jgi:signal transduction histidine kinase
MNTSYDDSLLNDMEEALSQLADGNLRGEKAQSLHDAIEIANQLRSKMQELVYENTLLRQELELILQSRDAYVSVISHELRIPMTAIKGYADLLRQGVVGSMNEMQLNFVDVIRNNVERMATLVSDLSDLSKLENRQLKFERLSFAPKEQIEQIVHRFQGLLDMKQQVLELDLADDLPNFTHDPQRFDQILANFIRNASMYTPEQGKITIRARRLIAYPAVQIEVIDTGIGVRLDEQEQLFTKFFRSEETFVRDQPGWGLGLSVNKALLDAMGGQVGFSNMPAGGSTFWFTLPLDHPGPMVARPSE